METKFPALSRRICHHADSSVGGEFREGEFSNAESAETKFPALSRRICHQADSSTVVRRFFRGTASLYIFSILFSRKSRVPLDAAFSYLFLFIPRLLFLPQGLFLPPGFIFILLFCAAGITSSARIHLYLALFLRRDYFFRADTSPACFFVPQGLLFPPGFIPSLLFSSAGITSSARIHLYLALFHRRDYFCRPDSSLSCSFSPQGLLLPPGFISILLFFSTGIIATARIHPQLAFFTAGMISTAQIHPQLAFSFRRDDFYRPDSSLASSFLPQG